MLMGPAHQLHLAEDLLLRLRRERRPILGLENVVRVEGLNVCGRAVEQLFELVERRPWFNTAPRDLFAPI